MITKSINSVEDLIERLRIGVGSAPDHALLIEASNALEHLLSELVKGLKNEEVLQNHLFIKDEVQAQQVAVPQWVLKYAQNIALRMAKDFYPEVSRFEVLDDMAGVVSQISNMSTGLQRAPQPPQGEKS